MMQFDAILDAQAEARQMSIDEYLALDRDGDPPEATAAVGIPTSVITERDVSHPKIGTIPHNGTCPYTQQCEERRRQLPTYRPFQPCHWRAWGDWRRCPIYRNEGAE